MTNRDLKTQDELPYIEVDIKAQKLFLYAANHQLIKAYACSSAKNGLGEEYGSFKTPRGKHIIRVKIGDGAKLGTVFVKRRPTGEIYNAQLAQQYPDRDWMLTRILWLKGLEPGKNRWKTVDTQNRKIYIHGVPDEVSLVKPRSNGCINLSNADVVDLFERVPVGTRVLIKEN